VKCPECGSTDLRAAIHTVYQLVDGKRWVIVDEARDPTENIEQVTETVCNACDFAGRMYLFDVKDEDVNIEGRLRALQGVCERQAAKMEKEGNKDAAFYHKILRQRIAEAVRYTEGKQ